MKKNKKQKIVKIIINPITGGIIATLAVFAGFLASLYYYEIRNSFPLFLSFNKNDYDGLSLSSLFFWIALIVFFVLTAIRQNFKDKEMAIQRTNLIDRLQTLPPHDFAIKYAAEYNRLKDDLEKLEIFLSTFKDDSEEIAEKDIFRFEEEIRVILDAYVNLAQIWDTPESLIDDEVVYRANLMLYRNINSLPKEIEDNLLEMTHFFVETNLNAIKSSIDGILFLEDNKFTTTTTISEEPLPDDSIKPLCLAVTYSEDKDKRKQNLPGAPKAFITKRTQWILDTHEIPRICEAEGSFDLETLNKIKAYYDADKKAISIISIPLTVTVGDQGQVVGIINIYRNKTMILRDEIRSTEFAAYLEPFNSLLYKSLKFYAEVCSVKNSKKNVD